MTVAPKHGESHSNPVDRRTDAQWIGGKPSVLIFDVNETLLDFESMNPLFKRVFGDERVLRQWFGQLIMYSMTLTLSGLYKDFFALGQGLFEMVGAIHKVKVKPADVEALKRGMLTMPAHADVEEGLKQLKGELMQGRLVHKRKQIVHPTTRLIPVGRPVGLADPIPAPAARR